MKQKEDFLNQLQFKIGDRWENLKPETINNVQDLKTYIIDRNARASWPFLHFLPFYFALRKQVSKMINQPVSGNYNLNQLSKSQRQALNNFISEEYAKPLTMSRPKTLHQIVFLFPLVTVLGSLLISTYLITGLDYSGLWYFSALIGLILSLLLFEKSKKFKNQFKPARILDYAKSFLVVNHQQYPTGYEESQLETFLLEELTEFYQKEFTPTATIG
ncbi:hypothetical protein DNU06_08745 [Putridiphycobacter roseus]|uniref:Uncharacterized protein n=1 Tax=Putridiphycobacter roseus TaxID=2219161 RepID=A0A2W1NRQ2_9FLAO|nr:hypothetical protein [Putridiphycobacter roseus]PZE17348.1 hypothetical protein DNU06_08745 [Putridiphycobacter roseus]